MSPNQTLPIKDGVEIAAAPADPKAVPISSKLLRGFKISLIWLAEITADSLVLVIATLALALFGSIYAQRCLCVALGLIFGNLVVKLVKSYNQPMLITWVAKFQRIDKQLSPFLRLALLVPVIFLPPYLSLIASIFAFILGTTQALAIHRKEIESEHDRAIALDKRVRIV